MSISAAGMCCTRSTTAELKTITQSSSPLMRRSDASIPWPVSQAASAGPAAPERLSAPFGLPCIRDNPLQVRDDRRAVAQAWRLLEERDHVRQW